MLQGYVAAFLSVAQNAETTATIIPNNKFTVKEISFSGNSTSTFSDDIYLNFGIGARKIFDNWVPSSALKNDQNGNIYRVIAELIINQKQILTVYLKNSTSGTLNAFNVVLIGDEAA